MQRGDLLLPGLVGKPQAAQQHGAGCRAEYEPRQTAEFAEFAQPIQRGQHQQCRVKRHGQCIRQERGGQIHGNGQQNHAERVFDAVHPRTCARHNVPAERADGDERNARAQCQRIQQHAAQQRIARFADIAQGGGQRRRNARADNQCRQHAHHKHGSDFAARQAVGLHLEIILHGGGQLQLEHAEHRQRQQHHQPGHGQHHPGLLQPHGQQRAGQSGQHAHCRVGQRQALHIHERQSERPFFAAAFIAHDNAGNDGQQRIHARGEAQAQSEHKKRQQVDAQRVAR